MGFRILNVGGLAKANKGMSKLLKSGVNPVLKERVKKLSREKAHLSDQLNKAHETAAKFKAELDDKAPKPFFTKFKDRLTTIGGLGLAAGTVGIAGALATRGYDSASDSISKGKAYKDVVNKNKWISKYDPGQVKSRFDTLYKFSPEMAQDPTVAGSFLRRSLDYADEGVHFNDVKSMVDINEKIQKVKSKQLFHPERWTAFKGLDKE